MLFEVVDVFSNVKSMASSLLCETRITTVRGDGESLAQENLNLALQDISVVPESVSHLIPLKYLNLNDNKVGYWFRNILTVRCNRLCLSSLELSFLSLSFSLSL